MNNTTTTKASRASAEARLFDTAMAELLTGDPLRSVTITQQAVGAPPRRMVAAVIFFGLTVAASSWWFEHKRQEHASQAQQPIVPLPIATVVHDSQTLKSLDANTVSLRLEEALPADLGLLLRFTQLRAVTMNPRSKLGGNTLWSKAMPADLEPLTRCANLEVLGLPFPLVLRPEHLDMLGKCRKLRRIRLIGQGTTLNQAAADALAQWPSLTIISMVGTTVTSKGIRTLAACTKLRELELHSCFELNDTSFGAITALPQLERLRLLGLGGYDRPAALRPDNSWEPNEVCLRQLRKLPKLEHLALQGLQLTSGMIDALPESLTELTLSSRHAIPSKVFQSLRRMRLLRALSFGRMAGSKQHYDATEISAADMLSSLQLSSFEWATPPSPAMVRAIASQPKLHAVVLGWHPEVDLKPLAGMPALKSLVLYYRELLPDGVKGPDGNGTTDAFDASASIANLASLRSCKSLESITLWSRGLDKEHGSELQKLLGDKIRLEHHR